MERIGDNAVMIRPEKLPVAEIFYSCQGEGKYIGHPSMFVRLGGCPLRCDWGNGNTCDTKYASYEIEQDLLSFMFAEEILQKADKLGNPSHWVITGGEVIDKEGLTPLLYELNHRGKLVTLESSGVNVHKNVLAYILSDMLADNLLLSFSPKLMTSCPKEGANRDIHLKNIHNRLLIEAVEKFDACDRTYKFVIADLKKDLAEVLEFQKHYKISNDRIYLMPLGVSSQDIFEKAKTLIPICKTYGFNYSDRQHIHIFGNRRGV